MEFLQNIFLESTSNVSNGLFWKFLHKFFWKFLKPSTFFFLFLHGNHQKTLQQLNRLRNSSKRSFRIFSKKCIEIFSRNTRTFTGIQSFFFPWFLQKNIHGFPQKFLHGILYYLTCHISEILLRIHWDFFEECIEKLLEQFFHNIFWGFFKEFFRNYPMYPLCKFSMHCQEPSRGSFKWSSRNSHRK